MSTVTSSVDNKLNVFDEIDHEFLDMLQGRDCISGTNTRYITRQIDKLSKKNSLTTEEKTQLRKYHNEIGHDNNGRKKPKVCWNYVNNLRCRHACPTSLLQGQVIGNLWHPDKDESEYLRNKTRK